MAEKIKITLGEASGLFSNGLAKLANLNIHSGRDAYALMRSGDCVTASVEPYRRCVLNLLKRHGARSSLADLREALATMEQGAGRDGYDSVAAENLKTKIAQLEPSEQFSLATTDAGYPAFVAEAKELADQTVELFLDHRVPVKVEQLPDGYFSPAELRALEPIVEFIEAPHPDPLPIAPPTPQRGEGK